MVNAVLVAGQPTQSLTVRWAGTPGEPNPGDGPAPSDVDLWITSTAGDSVTVAPLRSSSSYTIALMPHAGVTYRLGGTILGAAIAGSTTVPSIAITAPSAGDTLQASLLDPYHTGLVPIPVELVASGVGGYGVSSAQAADGSAAYLTNLKASHFQGPLNVIYEGPSALTVHADITAYDTNAAAFFGVIQNDVFGMPAVGGRITSTIVGVLGLFGSRSQAVSLDVVIEP